MTLATQNSMTPDIEEVYFSPNAMSLDQPLDQGAMRTFNAYHTQYIMENIVNSLEMNPHRKNIMTVWKTYSTEDVITVYRKKTNKTKKKKKQKNIQPKTVNSCWRKSCPNVVHGFRGFTTEPIRDTMKEIVDIVKKKKKR